MSGRGEHGVDGDGNSWVRRVVHVAGQTLGEHVHAAEVFRRGADHLPGRLGKVGRGAAENLAVEVFDNLRPAHTPPRLRSGDALAVLCHQRIRRRGVDVGLRLIVVGLILTQLLDPQQVHHAPMVLLGGQVPRRRKCRG